ncbi:hypothetical protein CRM22_003475 [Opisthorchis felineus]|uniref:PPM-type phosphatase domain-containing protein n=1 Tax=Opisthorchis felineus TaxID=147828 RepID=A0A4S2M1L2_OPIFE|nr:hypothetical protein CRM22_003475 [Opisthorchis felineus]
MSLFDDLPEPELSNTAIVENTEDQLQKDKDETSCTTATALLPLISCVVARKGERPEMQDAHVCIDDLSVYFRNFALNEVCRLSYYAVFDGHGGCKASVYASKRLHLYVCSRLPRSGLAPIEKDIKRVLYDSFKKTDEDFLREASNQRPHWRDGSTASTVLIVNNTMYIANLGDSKVVLGRMVRDLHPVSSDNGDSNKSEESHSGSYSLTAVCLTRDHNPMDYEERQRIQASGASVQNGRVNNILEVSRSFGDYQFKKQGVTCIPDVKKCQLTPNDRFLLIACDGLWKSFPPDEAVALTNRLLLKEFEALSSNGSQSDLSSNPPTCGFTQRHLESVCSHLVNEAVLRMSGDNVTCILLVFPDAFKSPNSVSPASPVVKDPRLAKVNSEDTCTEPPPKQSRIS